MIKWNLLRFILKYPQVIGFNWWLLPFKIGLEEKILTSFFGLYRSSIINTIGDISLCQKRYLFSKTKKKLLTKLIIESFSPSLNGLDRLEIIKNCYLRYFVSSHIWQEVLCLLLLIFSFRILTNAPRHPLVLVVMIMSALCHCRIEHHSFLLQLSFL